MTDLRYSRAGGFSDYTVPDSIAWKDNEDFDAWRERVGYVEEVWRLGEYEFHGDVGSFGIRAYKRERNESGIPRYFVDLTDSDRVDHIFVEDAASLMHLRLELAPLAASWVGHKLGTLEHVADLAFRAWHGHDAIDFCGQCDPMAHKLRLEAKAKKGSASGGPR